MPKRLTFRDATREDVPRIVALLNAAAHALTDRYGGGHWSSLVTARGVQQLLFPPRGRVRVRLGMWRGRALTVLKLAEKKPWSIDAAYFTAVARPLYLTSLAVAVEYWGHGLGRMALRDAERVAHAWPADAIRLDAYDAVAGAGGFYEACGYRERGCVEYRAVPLTYYELLCERPAS